MLSNFKYFSCVNLSAFPLFRARCAVWLFESKLKNWLTFLFSTYMSSVNLP